MKKLFVFLLALLMLVSIVACKKDAEPVVDDSDKSEVVETEKPETEEKEKYVIGYTLNAMDDYNAEMVTIYEEIAAERGYEMHITVAEGSIEKQIADIESLIVLKPDLIAGRAIDTAGSAPGFQAAIDAGFPVISDGFYVDCPDVCQLTSSQIVAAEKKAEYLIELLDADPDLHLNICYIYGYRGASSSNERFDGWFNKLSEKHSDRFTLLADKVCNWSATEAMAVTEDWIQAYPEMNCIIVASDEMALGCCNVLEAAGIKDEVMVIGIDGSIAAQDSLKKGIMDATVYSSKRLSAIAFFDACDAILKEGKDLSGKEIMVENAFLMVADNVDELIKQYG